ncbi:hypothetical protein [Jeotgalibacillus sp. R-1-5s-1]|uniref:hypothetical protein n=1 Tax=Jeotgalibacillus sp. R-1-5s-1 TaxID=2555897 RepID=UPI001069AA75|nr:hypothetical protein [Jeotgalibacillus sp. R-1-5s-1]TFE01329.1 hypothetical protein E2491_03780 [Jeotgalibacillus sp. R-1-5s-1]
MEANRKWLSIPEQTRKMLIGNVFCSQCLDAVTIKDFIITGDPAGVVLEGKCAACGHPVARVVEMDN